MEEVISVKKLVRRRKVTLSHTMVQTRVGPVVVSVERRNKNGDLIFPYLYKMALEKVKEYPLSTLTGGWLGYYIPLRDFEKVGKRFEIPGLQVPPGGGYDHTLPNAYLVVKWSI